MEHATSAQARLAGTVTRLTGLSLIYAFVTLFFVILCPVGHFKAATIKWFAYIWKSTSIIEALAPDQAGKIHLVTVINASLVVVLV